MIHSLRLQNFRCFHALDIDLPDAGGIFVGDNGQGKTSILEAVCVLTRLHSPRTSQFTPLSRMASGSFGIATSSANEERSVRQSPEGLFLKVNGETRPSRASFIKDGGLLVWMGNEDLELVRGPGEVRRRFIDFIGNQCDPHYRHAWTRYSRALKAKNLLLKEGKNREAEVNSYEEILIEHGTYLIQKRAHFLSLIAPLATAAHQKIAGNNELLTVQYLPSAPEDLRSAMRQSHESDWRQRVSTVGPHRDDISLRLQGLPAAVYASEGQQRTLALALKIAQGELITEICGTLPLYLLDDIFGELDPTRRNALLNSLPPLAQKWITTTHLDWLNDSPQVSTLKRFYVKNGAISHES